MSDVAVLALSAALAIVGGSIFPALSQGKTSVAAMEAIARQPDAAGNIRSTLIISMALMEALAIYALLIAFMLISKM